MPFPFKGPIYFSRTTDGGATWSPAARISGNGSISQTIGNQIVVLPDLNDGTFEGQLVDGFNFRSLTKGGNNNGFDNVAVIRSSDHGATWSNRPIIVSKLYEVDPVDPDNGDPIRSSGGIPEFAVNRTDGTLTPSGRTAGSATSRTPGSRSRSRPMAASRGVTRSRSTRLLAAASARRRSSRRSTSCRTARSA